jgi:hypothetical protein
MTRIEHASKPPRQQITHAAALVITLLTLACGGHSTSTTAPTPNPAPASTPRPTPTPGPAVPFSLSGVVVDVYTGRPIPGVSLNVYATGFNAAGRFGAEWRAASLTADASGHYELSTIPDSDPIAGAGGGNPLAADAIWVYGVQNGYAQPCAATTAVVPNGGAVLNVQMAPAGGLAEVVRVALMSPPGTRTISGSVFQTTAAGKQPVQGAWVGWEPLFDTVVAEVRSDITGRYTLCGLPMNRFELFAVRSDPTPSNSPISVPVEAGVVTVDIEIP